MPVLCLPKLQGPQGKQIRMLWTAQASLHDTLSDASDDEFGPVPVAQVQSQGCGSQVPLPKRNWSRGDGNS